MPSAIETTYRVIPLPDEIKKGLQTARKKANQTNCEFVAEAIGTKLPVLVEDLGRLGFASLRGKRRPVRLPFTAGALKSLRTASNRLQIPVVQLLSLSLAAAVEQGRGTGRRKTKRTRNSTRSSRVVRRKVKNATKKR